MSADNLAPQIISRLGKEINILKRKPTGGFTYIETDNDTVSEIHALLVGPGKYSKLFLNKSSPLFILFAIIFLEDTPFYGGKFRLKLVITADYPTSAPKGYFMTKIFHPNVAPETGDICVNSLKRDWKPEITISEILQIIRCLIIEPNPESALNEEAGKLFMESYDEYSRKAKILTDVHATSTDDGEEENIAVETNGVNLVHGVENKLNGGISSSSDVAKVKSLATSSSGPDSFTVTEVSKEISAVQKVKKKALKRL